MDPVSLTASLIAILQISGTLISALYDYRSSVRDASKDAACIIDELNGLRNILESLLQVVEREEISTNSRLRTFQELIGPNGGLERCKSDLESIGEMLAINTEGSPWKSMKRSLVWPFKEKEIEKVLQKIQRAKGTLHFALSADQTMMSLEIHEGVESLVRGAATSALDQRKSKILKWLNAPDPSTNHAAARKKREPLTGDWFFSSKHYEDYKTSSRSFLWLYGIPGAGKSVLCSSIIEDLISECKSKDSCIVTYFYFDFNDIGKRDVESLVRALTVQLLLEIPLGSKSVEVAVENMDEQPDLESLSRILHSFTLEFDRLYIVVDALDECSDCEELMTWLEDVYGWQSHRIHILVTSRRLPEIEDLMNNCATATLCLQDSNLGQDIKIFIQHQLRSDRKFQKWPPVVCMEIEVALTSKASGMFRWVVCQLEMLRNCVTLPALRKAISSMPKTLDETYERILANINDYHVSDVKKILQFLAFTIQPVSLSEMVEVLAIDWDSDKPRFTAENRIPDPKDILTMCSTLVNTSEESKINLPDGSQDTRLIVRLAHFSVKEYLLSNRIKTSKASLYALDANLANLFIVKTYLVYLLSSEFSTGYRNNFIGDISYNQDRTMLRNAKALWPIYVEIVGNHIDDEAKSLISQLFATRHTPNGGEYAKWVKSLIPRADSETIMTTPPLYYAASYSMIPIVKMILSEIPKSDIDLKGGRAKSSPLQVACFRGKPEIVQLLLEAGADPNSTNYIGQSCLFWAKQRKLSVRTKICDLLLKYGANDRRVKPHSPLVEEMTPQDMLDDEHYVDEYYRLAASESKDKSD